MTQNYVTLIGTEQVQNAANHMQSAAQEMRRAASAIDSALTQHQQFLDGWLIDLRRTLEAEVNLKVTLKTD